MMAEQFIVLCGQDVGGGDHPFEIVYGFDGERFADRQAAIQHGLAIRGSDDFNIATVAKGHVVAVGWMEEDHPHDPEAIADINRQVRL